MTLQHVVLLHFPQDLATEDVAEMRQQVTDWPAQIGGFDKLRLGPPLNPERSGGYQYLLFIEVEDKSALVTYQEHPAHQRFLRWLRARDGTSLAFDYKLDDETVIVS